MRRLWLRFMRSWMFRSEHVMLTSMRERRNRARFLGHAVGAVVAQVGGDQVGGQCRCNKAHADHTAGSSNDAWYQGIGLVPCWVTTPEQAKVRVREAFARTVALMAWSAVGFNRLPKSGGPCRRDGALHAPSVDRDRILRLTRARGLVAAVQRAGQTTDSCPSTVM
jgi:hypothetical protein